MRSSRLFVGGALTITALFATITISQVAGQNSKKEATFNRDVAPILHKNCAACHRPDDIAPMSLLTYKDARPWAKSIREQVSTRQMPPWRADPRHGEFANDARLSSQEIETIIIWVEQGAKEGDAKDMPPAPRFVEGWKMGQPDVVISMLEDYTIAPTGPDEYVTFVVPTGFTEDKWVRGIEMRPGNRRVVHHGHVFVAAPDPANPGKLKLPIRLRTGNLGHAGANWPVVDDGCSSPDGGRQPGQAPSISDFTLISYLPGRQPDIWPDGYAKRIPAGSSVIFQLHYSRTTGAPEKDRTSVGLIFAKQPPEHEVKRIEVRNFLFKIPPGAESHRVTACYTFDRDVQAMGYTAHMHFRGKASRFEAIYPDGRRETLLDIPDYSFNWQMSYKLKRPQPLPKGTRIVITSHFDNSSRNKFNPDPAKTIRYGEPSDEEMADGWIEYIEDKPESGGRGKK